MNSSIRELGNKNILLSNYSTILLTGTCYFYDCSALSHLLELVHEANKTQAFTKISQADYVLTKLDFTGKL